MGSPWRVPAAARSLRGNVKRLTLETEVAVPAVDEQRVKEIIVAVYARSPERQHPLRADELHGDTALYSEDEQEPSLGLDSLDAVEIATELEEAFDVVLPAEIDPAELRTVRQVVELLERLLAEQRDEA